jgi:hypothetical protein
MTNRGPRPYSNPYVAGVGLGLVLLAAFAIAERGLGASGAFTSAAAGLALSVAPERAHASALLAGYVNAAGGPWREWLVFEIAGVALGGALSAAFARRLRFAVERGPAMSRTGRLAAGFGGGAVMGLGAALARGCTSGQALTGGALLSVGSWLFMLAAFAGAYALAPIARKAWQ